MKKRIIALLAVLSLAVCAFGISAVSLADETTDTGVAWENKYEPLVPYGGGIFFGAEQTNSLGGYFTDKYMPSGGVLNASCGFELTNSPLCYGSSDAWLCISLSASPGVKRPNESPASDASILLRISDFPEKGNTVTVGEFFSKGALVGGRGTFPYETGALAVRFTADDNSLGLYINGSLVRTFDSLTAADYANGAYISFCTYNSSIDAAIGRNWQLYGSAHGYAYIENGVIDRKTSADRAVFGCYDFGAGITSVKLPGSETPLEIISFDALEKKLTVSDPSQSNSAVGSKINYVITDGNGCETTVTATVVDTSEIEAEQTNYAYVLPREDALVIPLETAGIGELSASAGGGTDGLIITAESLTVSHERLVSLGYGSHSVTVVGKKSDGSQTSLVLTVTVSDSRLPELNSDTLTVRESGDGVWAQSALSVSLYDANIESVTACGTPVTDFTATANGISFGADAFSSLDIPYGESECVIVTDKGELKFALVKTSAKQAVFETSYEADKAEVYELGGFGIAVELYGDAVALVGTPQAVDEKYYKYENGNLVLSPEVFEPLTLGSKTVTITLKKESGDSYTRSFELVVLDTRTPTITAYRNYDIGHPDASAIYEFSVYDYSSVTVSGADGGTLYSSSELGYDDAFRITFEKSEFTGMNVGDSIAVTVSATSRTGEAYEHTEQLPVVNTAPKDTVYEKDDDELDFEFPFDSNGSEIVKVTLDGEDSEFVYADGIVTVPLASLYDAYGDVSVCIRTLSFDSEFENAFTLSVRELRSARADGYELTFDKSAPADAKVLLEIFAHTFDGLCTTAGALDEKNYSFVGGELTVKRSYLQTLPRSGGKLWAKIDGEAALCFNVTVCGDNAPQVLSASGTADLAAPATVNVSVSLKEEKVTDVKVDGKSLSRAYYNVTDSVFTLKDSYLSTLKAGEYVYEIVTAGGTCSYKLTVSDTRVQLLGENTVAYDAASGDFRFAMLKYSVTELAYYLDGVDVTKYVTEEDGSVTVSAEAFANLRGGVKTLTVRSENGDATLSIRFTPKPTTDLSALWYTLATVLPLLAVGGAFAAIILFKKRGKPQIK